jgi:hypothetical protein
MKNKKINVSERPLVSKLMYEFDKAVKEKDIPKVKVAWKNTVFNDETITSALQFLKLIKDSSTKIIKYHQTMSFLNN